MKKLLALIICFELVSLTAFSEITDEFAEKTLDKNIKIREYRNADISDTFAQKTLDKNLKIREKKERTIKDTFAEQNKNKNSARAKKLVIFDESTMTPVSIRIKREFSSKDEIQEGDVIEFELAKAAKIKGKSYPIGTTVKSKLETVSMNDIMGVPSDVVIGNFSLDDIQLGGEISKVGANRSLWVYPSIHVFNIFFGLGLLLIPLRGGHAKIKPSETFTLYAE